MSKLSEIILYLVSQGLAALKRFADEQNAAIDYVAIFCKDENEYRSLEQAAESLGREVDKETIKTGRTFLLDRPLSTPAGELKLVKIRKPDNTRPQRGAPDFKIQNYREFKDKYIRSGGNFTLMLKKDYEMIELKGEDVLIYLPDKTLGERMKKQ